MEAGAAAAGVRRRGRASRARPRGRFDWLRLHLRQRILRADDRAEDGQEGEATEEQEGALVRQADRRGRDAHAAHSGGQVQEGARERLPRLRTGAEEGGAGQAGRAGGRRRQRLRRGAEPRIRRRGAWGEERDPGEGGRPAGHTDNG